MTQVRRSATGAVGLFAMLFLVGAAEPGLCQTPVAKDRIKVANSCAAKCRAAHNQCRIRTKGASHCDAKLSACLQACLKR